MALPGQGKTIDVIATEILLDAKQAILSLKGFNNSLKDPQARLKFLKDLVRETATQMNGDFRAATAAVSKFSSALNMNPAQVRQVGKELQGVGDTGEHAFKRVFTSINTARIALGALVSMLLFQAIQAVTSFFTGAIDQARQYEATLYRIANAERQLSMEGFEVSVEGLKKGIKDIQKALPIFSKEDVAQLVGSLATTTKELGFTEDQIIKLGAAVAILNVNSTETETLLQTQAKVTNSLVSPQAKSIGNLGLSFGKAKIEAKGFELGILQVGESFDDLTEREKSFIKFSIVLKTAGIENIDNIEDLREKIQEAGGDFGALNDYLESNDAKLLQNSAAWKDLQTAFGQVFIPFIPLATEFFNTINDGLSAGKVLIIEVLTRLGVLGGVIEGVFSGRIKNIKEFTEYVRYATDVLRTDLTNTFFKEVPEDAPDWFMRGWGDRIKSNAETATSAFTDMYDSIEENEDAEKALEDIEEKVQDIILSAKQAQEDLDLKLQQKQEDLDVEYGRKEEDAARDHAQKIIDINLDAQRKAEDAKAKLREDEKKAEQDLLQKLKELRQRFLLDLEDALHARDARQVLRLIKEYKLEKQNLLDRKKLDDEQRKQKLADDLRQIELERQRRIQNENVEYQRKLSDLATAKAREQEELQLWYKREQDDIQRNVEQKLQKLIAGYIAEGKIHESEQARIYGILAKYFAKDMALVDSLAQFMASRFAQVAAMASMPISTAPIGLGASGGQTGAPAPYWKLLEQQNKQKSPYWQSEHMAEGGTLVANRPTAVMFGDRGMEAATFTPIGRTGLDAGKIFGDVDGGGGVNGQIIVDVDLSPGLEARIVSRSMDGVASVIGRVNRKKQ